MKGLSLNERIAIRCNHVLDQLNACRAMSGKSWSQLSSEAGKDSTTLRKQFERDSNPKLSTLVELTMLFDATIILETENSKRENVDAYRDRLNELQAERDMLKTERDHLKELVQQQSDMIDAQTHRISTYDAQVADMQEQMKNRLQYMGKIFDSYESDRAKLREVLQENRELLGKLLAAKGVEL